MLTKAIQAWKDASELEACDGKCATYSLHMHACKTDVQVHTNTRNISIGRG